ncbi:MAG: outer membrane protein OmpA-like peptidoglycan-associated protein, partial [Flavobacteriales bacterium]
KQGAVYNITPKSDKYERKLMSLTSDKKMSPEIYDLDLKVDFAANKPSLPVTFVMKELYFELNEAYIYEKSSTDLNKLHAKLAKNQDINITVIGHTDSRGPAEYNLTLSQKRANAVVEWLIYQGIDRRRLTAVGKGESELVNDCEDGVSCSAKEHKDNRRTTFTINKRDRR